MDSSFLTSHAWSSTTSQSTQSDGDFSDIVIAGLGEKGFQFYSEGIWKPADLVIDNGMQRGYSAYHFNALVGCGKLIVYDEIDKETDILDGGYVPYGWVTNFPEDYVLPSDDFLARYQDSKSAFRKDFTTWPLLKDADAGEVGQSVYKLAASDPLAHYGLGETEISQQIKFSVGFDGTSHRLPTITSDWNYYSALLSTENKALNYPCPPIGGGDDDAASDTSSATLGRSSDGGYA
ncbi:hypothetical protein F4782DRAFT_545421 [Xylaria castorea]|nr:hypothetical protein F4782DRAFT_545421 [Xylaria castorea]